MLHHCFSCCAVHHGGIIMHYYISYLLLWLLLFQYFLVSLSLLLTRYRMVKQYIRANSIGPTLLPSSKCIWSGNTCILPPSKKHRSENGTDRQTALLYAHLLPYRGENFFLIEMCLLLSAKVCGQWAHMRMHIRNIRNTYIKWRAVVPKLSSDNCSMCNQNVTRDSSTG